MYADYATFRRPNQETKVAETHRNNGGAIRGSLDEGACSYILHNGAISAPFYSQVKLQLQQLCKLNLSQHWSHLYLARNDFRSPPFPAVSKQEAAFTESHRSHSITIHKGDFS